MITVISPQRIGIPERYLRVCDTEEVRLVMEYNKDKVGRWDKEKEFRFEGKIPNALYWLPELKHIFHHPDQKEKIRLRKRFFREHHKLLGK